MAPVYETESDQGLLKTETERPPYIQEWLKKNTFHHSSFRDPWKLHDKKEELGVKISVCLPTLNEEKTVGKEIKVFREELQEKVPLIDEIVVVDSGSTDRTEEVVKEAGGKFYYASEILPQYRTYRGKGENLWKSLYVLEGDIICWIDADITNIHPRFVLGLVGPLLFYQHLKYVKAFYKRPIRIKGELHYTGGGRVTELVVRPFFNLLFPELTGIAQPLSGEYAGRRELLERLPFFTGYGVETGHLIDILRLEGLNVIGQCDLDVRIHRNQSIEALRSMSYRILTILLQRADDMGRIEIFHDISDSLRVITGVKNDYSIEKMKVWGTERPPMITIKEYREKRGIVLDNAETEKYVEPLPYTASLMFHEEHIHPNLRSRNKYELVKELLGKGKAQILDLQTAERALLESYEIIKTPIKKNIAIFHAFGDFVDDIITLVGVSKKGVVIDENSGEKCHIIFMVLAPEYLGNIYERIVDSLTKIFSRMEHFEWLLRCKTPKQIIAFISYLESKNKIMKMLGIEDFKQVTI